MASSTQQLVGMHACPSRIMTWPTGPTTLAFMAYRRRSWVLRHKNTLPQAPLPRNLTTRYWLTNMQPLTLSMRSIVVSLSGGARTHNALMSRAHVCVPGGACTPHAVCVMGLHAWHPCPHRLSSLVVCGLGCCRCLRRRFVEYFLGLWYYRRGFFTCLPCTAYTSQVMCSLRAV